MKSRYTKINLEKSNRSVSREAERTIVREHSRSYKDDVANLRGSSSILISIAVLGVMIYAITGTISLFFNDHYLNYYSLTNFTNDKLLAQHIGIFTVEIGIGLTVSSVMYLIYTLFSYE
ncbi:MAG: palindromic element RPE5 domain-containing protein [Rickettsia endosymbiont of Pentastiridius leporinus]